MRRKKEGCFISFLVIILLTGLFLAMFPIIWGAAMDKTISENAQLFLKRDEAAESADSYVSESQLEETKPYQELWEEMVAYNETIYVQGQTGLSCEYAYQKPSFDLADYGIPDEVFGVLTIPAMDLELPIYLGATESHMALGAAHLSQTSCPLAAKTPTAFSPVTGATMEPNISGSSRCCKWEIW